MPPQDFATAKTAAKTSVVSNTAAGREATAFISFDAA
jgi:hypothetical protein